MNVCSGAEREVGRGELGEFGYPQPGLDSEDQQGVVASAGPCCRVAGGQDGVGFEFGEVGDERLVVAFGGDGEDTLDRCGMFGVPERGVVEQGADRGETVVPGSDTVGPVGFEMFEERGDERGQYRAGMAACRSARRRS